MSDLITRAGNWHPDSPTAEQRVTAAMKTPPDPTIAGPVTLQPGSIPGVPEGYRIKKIDHVDYDEVYLDSRGTLQRWPYRENPSPYVHVVLEKIEQEQEAVLTLRLTDELRKILYHPKGFWIKANGCISVDLDASCVEIRPKGAAS